MFTIKHNLKQKPVFPIEIPQEIKDTLNVNEYGKFIVQVEFEDDSPLFFDFQFLIDSQHLLPIRYRCLCGWILIESSKSELVTTVDLVIEMIDKILEHKKYHCLLQMYLNGSTAELMRLAIQRFNDGFINEAIFIQQVANSITRKD